MEGWIKYNEQEAQQALDLINQIDDCLRFPQPGTETWQDGAIALCSLDASSAYTQFWGYVVKIDTEQLSDCLTPQQVDNIIQLPEGLNVCGTNQII
jgi:hypothetical protein